jgi:hypothetical protein
MCLAGCSIGTADERATASRIKFERFAATSSNTYLLRDTFYIELTIHAQRDDLLESANEGSLLSDVDFRRRGVPGVFGDILGTYTDETNECQVNLELLPGAATIVRAGIVCPDE